jgi:hypothetical protein
MNEALCAHPRADARFFKKVRNPPLNDAGAHALLHVLEASSFEDNRLNATLVEEVSEEESGRPRTDDDDLRAN